MLGSIKYVGTFNNTCIGIEDNKVVNLVKEQGKDRTIEMTKFNAIYNLSNFIEIILLSGSV
jgi:hypothetical protein